MPQGIHGLLGDRVGAFPFPGRQGVEQGLRAGEKAGIRADEHMVPQADVKPVAEFHRDAPGILIRLEVRLGRRRADRLGG